MRTEPRVRVGLRTFGLGLIGLGLSVSAAWSEPAVAIVQAIGAAEVVVLGEVHDNPTHHNLQREIMTALDPAAVVFEMITPDQAQLVTATLAQDADALADALNWADSGWPDFAMYHPLFAQAADAAVFGAQVPRDAARAAFAEGASAVFPGDAARFGLTDPLDVEEQSLRETGQQEAHCNALPEDILPGFVEAQRLRDAMLAEAALTALETHGAPVVVITGNGHARTDWGVPALLAHAAPEVSVFALGQFEAEPDGPVPFDGIAVADPVERPDPCEAFR